MGLIYLLPCFTFGKPTIYYFTNLITLRYNRPQPLVWISESCEKRLLASSCLSFRPHISFRFPLDGFSWNLILETFIQICCENQKLADIGHTTWGCKYVCIVAGDKIAIKAVHCKGTHCFKLLASCNTIRRRRHCYVSLVTVFTRTGHVVTLYWHCLSCFICTVCHQV